MNNISKPNLIAIVPAGGVGLRANGDSTCDLPKQYRLIKGISMLRWSVLALLAEPAITRVFVGVQADDTLAQPTLNGLDRVAVSPTAGTSRALTVLQTLDDALRQGAVDQDDWVLVHDAARPGLPLLQLKNLISVCLKNNVGGLLAMPAIDTVKLAKVQAIDSVTEVEHTVLRERVWMAQTPQMFPVGLLQRALSGALEKGFEVTDEASAAEWAGEHPLLVPGALANFKVTWPEDFEQIERFLK